MVQMRPLRQEGCRIGHIGGAFTYVVITSEISPSVLGVGLATDNVIRAVYFITLFALAAKTPPESSISTTDVEKDVKSESKSKLPLLQSSTTLAISFAIYKIGSLITKYLAYQEISYYM
ncbi:uncharacterized protein LOC111884923 isoform X3 [Lactuca sativa]|nr:uncharacterized protein LOC111884923 isoform X3 [Lactuca sativa]